MATILVIDDLELHREMARTVLEHLGHRVLTASDAISGGLLAQQCLPDLILMDVVLPGMDGLTAVQQLKIDPRTADTAVLLMTAYGEDFVLDGRSRLLGCVGCLVKPFTADMLRRTVSNVLASTLSK